MTYTPLFAKNNANGIVVSDNTSYITFQSGHTLPADVSNGQFRLTIENEIMTVTDVSGDDYYVTRAVEDTVEVTHSPDVTGHLNFTASYINLVNDQVETNTLKLDGIETGATADQSDSEIETAYNNQVSVVSQVDAEAGTSTTVYRWTPERVKQAIQALDTSNSVNSVNSQTGIVVLDADDIDDTSTTNKFATSSQLAKVDYLTITQAVDLDTLESNVATNNSKISYTDAAKVALIDVTGAIDLDILSAAVDVNSAKVSNATHTGEVTGSTTLTLDPTAISGKTGVTAVSGDYLLLWDATDSTLKKVNASELIGGGINNVVEDTTPQLGGMLDINGNSIGDGTLELLSFSETASAVNEFTISNAATGSGPTLSSTGGDTNINMNFTPKGTGSVHISSALYIGSNLDITGNMTITGQARHGLQQSLTTTGAVSWDIDAYPKAKIAPITGNITLTISNIALNSEATLYFTQNASTAYTITWPSTVKWSRNSAPDLSTLSSQFIMSFYSYDGTNVVGAYVTTSTVVSASGDVTGPSTSTNFSLAVFDGTTGKLLQDSVIIVDATGNLSGINNITVTGLIDGRDVAADGTKLDYITITQAVDLDTLESNVATNNAKVSNATHTGEVTGSTSLTIDPTAISGKTTVTAVTGDYVLLWDATDSTLKKANASDFLTGGGINNVVEDTTPQLGGMLDVNTYGLGDGTLELLSFSETASAVNEFTIANAATGSGPTLSATGDDTNININFVPKGTGLVHIGSNLDITGELIVRGQARHIAQTTLTTTGSVSWDIKTNPKAKISPITGNITLTISNIELNSEATLYFVQDAATAYTIGWPGTVKWAGNSAPDLSTLSSQHIISFYSYDGTNVIGNYVTTSTVSGLGGDVVGPTSATDSAIALFDSTTGQLIKDSVVLIDATGNLSGINNITVTGLIDGRDVAADGTKLDYITVTQAVDLDTLESNVATNNAKVSNATHTGDATGSTALTIVPSFISGKTEVTAASGDYFLLWDATDSALKKTPITDFTGGGGGSGLPVSTTTGGLLIADGSGGWGEDNNPVTITKQARHSENTTLSTSGTINWDIRNNPKATINPTGNITLNLTNVDLNSEAVLYFVQDSSSAYTINWDADIAWSGGYDPDISTLGSQHLFSFYSYDGTGLIGVYVNTENQLTGLFNVLDTTSDQYYIGSVAVANPASWGTYAVIQFQDNFSIYSTNSANTSNTIANNLYLDISGLSRYTSDADGQRITFNAGETEFYYSDGTVHIADDLANVYRRFTVGYSGISIRNNAGTLVFNVDVTGNITTSGLVDGIDVAAIGTKVNYLTVTGSTNLDTINTKVGYLTVTQAVDLDTLESDVATNTAKVSNATHTGEVTGSTSLVIDPTAISGKTTVTPVATDMLLLWDATDSTLKKADASNFLTVYGDVTGPASSTDSAIALFNSTSGKLLKNSVITIDTDGDVAGVKSISFNGATSGTSVLSAPAIAGTGVFSLPGTGTDTLVATAAVQVISNKTIMPRIETVTDSTSISFNCDDYDMGSVTLTASRVMGAPTGTPHDGQKYLLKVVQGGSGSYTFTSYNSVFSFGDAGEPTLSTTVGKYDYLFFIYSSSNTKWNHLTIGKGF